MDSKFADMISWCQAIANAYEAYSKGRMSKETYLAIFKEKLKDKPDLKKCIDVAYDTKAINTKEYLIMYDFKEDMVSRFGDEEEDYENCD